MNRGKTFIISGPSGVGKGSVLRVLLEKRNHIYVSVSATTRPQRPGEEDGVHYHFLDVETFRQRIARDEFLEYAEYVGNFYGTPKEFVDTAMEAGRDVILEIDVQGALQVAAKRPEAILIFIAPPSWEELERRLVGRGTEDMEKVRSRLARGKEEFSAAKDFDYLVINDTVDHAVEELQAIMLAEHCRPVERTALITQ